MGRNDRRVDKLYAVQYGKGFLYGGPDFAFIYYIVKLGQNWILIDTGFSSPELAKVMGITMLPIDEEVGKIVKPEQIRSILITHSHWDHIDDVYQYTNATIYITQKSYEKAIAENCERTKEYLQKARENGKLCFIASGTTVLDVFTYEEVGGHAEDSGVFHFEQNGKNYCLTGDECFSIDYFQKNIPIDNAYNLERNEQFTDRSHVAGAIPLPSHDGSLMKLYEREADNIVRIL